MTATDLSAYNLDTSRSEIRGIQIRTWAGLDLGQKQDFTTLAVIESHEITYADRNPVTYEFLKSTHHAITHLERLPLRNALPRDRRHSPVDTRGSIAHRHSRPRP